MRHAGRGGQGEENSSIVGDLGQVYLNGLPERGSLKVRWGVGRADREPMPGSF
ncbi:TPA: hypothetical protein O8L60_004618 [Enterobacter cloacae]|nr:hypothetical protein [Enterobacter cloacae]